MKNIIVASVLSLLAASLLVGCAVTSTGDAIAHKTVSTKEMHDIIKKAAEDEGWRMTEFRGNSMIAEKDGVVTTVTYQNAGITIDPDNSSLKRTIESALNH